MKLRRFAFNGHVSCTAVLVETAIIGPRRAAERVLALWTLGTVVYELELGYLVRFPRPMVMDTRGALGIPLVEWRRGTLLLGAPLREDEVDALSPSAGSVVLARGGAAAVHSVPDGPFDVSQWLDIGEWDVVEVEPLGAAPPTPMAAEAAVQARAILAPDRIGAQAAGAAELERALAQMRDHLGGSPHARSSVFASILLALSRLFGSRPSTTRSNASQPTPSRRLFAAIERWISRALLRANLARYLARRHSQYLDRLFDMFDRGDLDAALKHAIPLGGRGRGDLPLALGAPSARSDLALRPDSPGPSTQMLPFDGMFETLRSRYRAAFERLEREERIEEAAFVLAELLHAEEEAVAFLERHGRLQMAAELAEGRKLAPALRVRQWYLAGEHGRAIRVARAHGGYADAIARLERSGKRVEAEGLRLEWANALASAGQFEAAADVAWAAARQLALGWLDLAIMQGGVSGARALARKVGVAATSDDVSSHVSRVLDAMGSEGRVERQAFAAALVRADSGPHHAPSTRATLRALLADAEHDVPARSLVDDLSRRALDGPLQTDRPALPVRRPLPSWRLAFASSDRGSRAAEDIAILTNGRTLVALGEAGVVLLDRSGRAISSFDQPATRLVVSDHGDRALAIAARGAASRVARIDVASRRSQAWCEIVLAGWAPSFDGSSWVVAVPSTDAEDRTDLLVIDATIDGVEVLRSWVRLGHAAALIERSATASVVLTRTNGSIQAFWFELPAWTLRGVYPSLDFEASPASLCSASTDGTRYTLGEDCVLKATTLSASNPVLSVGSPEEIPRAIEVGDSSIAVLLEGEGGLRVAVCDRKTLAIHGEIVLAGARRAKVRLDIRGLAVADDCGRVLGVEVSSGEVLRDHRL